MKILISQFHCVGIFHTLESNSLTPADALQFNSILTLLPGESVRSHRLRTQDSTSDANRKSMLLSVLLTDWLSIRCSHNPILVFGCSVVSDPVTPWTIAQKIPLSMIFSRQEYWSGLPFPTPENIPYPGIETTSLVSPTLTVEFFTTVPPGKP